MRQSLHDRRPAFLVTIDTEGDNLWARAPSITVENARFLPRFQALCQRHGIRPTYLTNWEMAQSPVYEEFAHDVLDRDAGEIGMHLHAWNSPPIVPLTEDDNKHHPYLIEFPEPILREKVKVMTHTLEENLGVKMLSHRAGRFSFNEVYARALIDHGYLVDGSVTPHVSWKGYPGDPNGAGGTDFTNFPEQAYFLDPRDIRRRGASTLLEIPVTVTAPWFSAPVRGLRGALCALPLGKKVANRLFPTRAWLYPKGNNHRWLPRLLQAVQQRGSDFAEFMIHSSELMPSGSPNFPTTASIDRLYETLEHLFALAARDFIPMTMREYHKRVAAAAQPAFSAPARPARIAV
jgi:hypothetical protein